MARLGYGDLTRNNERSEDLAADVSEDEQDIRAPQDVRRHNRKTLVSDEEAERLLAEDEKARQRGPGDRYEDQRVRHKRRGSKKHGQRTEREIVYEVEDGPRSSSEESSGHSSEVDMARLGNTLAKHKVIMMCQTKRRPGTMLMCVLVSNKLRPGRFAAIHVVIIVAFLALLYGAWRASHGKHTQGRPADSSADTLSADQTLGDERPAAPLYQAQKLSNGTHTFAPTTILISLDGFRADFLQRNLTPALNAFVRSGISPAYMNPSFPSLTFPNHFTLVTGLHPESHGVVGNTFWDPNMQREFYYTDPARSMQPEWWNAQPLWETAELQGVKSAIHMWPGSEAHIDGVDPSILDEFNADEQLEHKVSRILGWLDLPDSNAEAGTSNVSDLRPQLIAAYVPNVDADGHLYGPNSSYIRSTITEVDGMLGSLFHGLEDRNLTALVNVVIVSDHGMATTSNRRLIQFEDLVNTDLIEHIDGWPLYGLRPYDQSSTQLQKLYQELVAKTRLRKYKDAFNVYLRDSDMPTRYHFAKNDRIAPLWIVPKVGWAIVTKDEYDVAVGTAQNHTYDPRGLHGYDHQHPLMRAIFIARGPAFPHPQGSKVEPFQNTEVYNIVCDSIGIQPMPNNGTLRLPLTPSGMHDFEAPFEVPHDLQDDDELPPEVQNLGYSHDPDHDSAHDDETHPPKVSNLANRPELSVADMSSSSVGPESDASPFGVNRPDLMVPTEGVPPVSSILPATPSKPGMSTAPHDAEQPSPARPVVHDGIDDDEKDGDVNRWWEWVTGKIEAIKGWASEVSDADINLAGSQKDKSD